MRRWTQTQEGKGSRRRQCMMRLRQAEHGGEFSVSQTAFVKEVEFEQGL